ncbi:hypothetical protein OCL06_05150 [Alteromonas sp. ASW11-19]|uniref:Uncharacterized protein n=1 Tax=Alteromonas salexigens TaxID=2982530 RepID=A0ABT2VLM3_9ALTE|nr:hypothetical protein [Alteromonas salexigens]MCU7553980.1 hypothetical protein [Alteromonas salexigens]
MKNTLIMTGIAALGMFSMPTPAQDNNLSAALVDIAGAKICNRLENRFKGIQRENSQGKQVYSGTLWIHSCEVNYDGDDQDIMTLQLGVKGWRWLNRDKETMGADFSVSEFARFQVDVGLTGRIKSHYAPDANNFALWFKPVKPPQVNFNASGDVDVNKEGMWGTVLAGAATLVGQSPDTLADKKLVDKGEQLFTKKMDEGFSTAIDFCSGRIISELGQTDQATLFSRLNENPEASYKQVELVPSSFLLFGPYGDQSELLDLQLRLDNPADFKNKLICMEDAVELAQAYMQGDNRSPEVPGIKLAKDESDEGGIALRNEAQTCPVVAMFSTDKSMEQRTSLEFKVRDYSDPQPLMKCD